MERKYTKQFQFNIKNDDWKNYSKFYFSFGGDFSLYYVFLLEFERRNEVFLERNIRLGKAWEGNKDNKTKTKGAEKRKSEKKKGWHAQ